MPQIAVLLSNSGNKGVSLYKLSFKYMIEEHKIHANVSRFAVNHVIKIQELLNSLGDGNMEEITHKIIKSSEAGSESGIKRIVYDCFTALMCRPLALPRLVLLLKKLYATQSDINELGRLKSFFNVRDSLNITTGYELIAFLSEGLRQNLFTLTDIIELSDNFMLNQRSVGYSILFLLWFGYALSSVDPIEYKDRIDQLQSIIIQIKPNSNIKQALMPLNSYSRDNWFVYKNSVTLGYPEGSVSAILKANDINLLKKVFNKGGFDINQRVATTELEYCDFVKHSPTLIQFAAFFAARDCFTFLLQKGANTELLDMSKDHHSLAHFAIAGGDQQILKLCDAYGLDFSGTVEIAAMFHRSDSIQWILDMKEIDVYSTLGFHYAAKYNNLKFMKMCIEHGIDINMPDDQGRTPLHYAAMQCNPDSVNYLLCQKETNLNAEDSSGVSFDFILLLYILRYR